MAVDLIPAPSTVRTVAEIPEPELPPPAAVVSPPDRNRRVIHGRELQRSHMPGGAILWEQAEIIPERTEKRPTGRGAVTTTVVKIPAKRVVLWKKGINPADEARVMKESFHWRKFDRSEADPEHDEFDALLKVSTFFAAKFAAQFKIKPRKPLPGIFDLGECLISTGYVKLDLGPDRTREYLTQHATGQWGTVGRIEDVVLDDESRFAPVAFGTATENAWCIECGWGIVRSSFPIVLNKQRPPESVEIVSIIGEATCAFCPSRGG